MRFSLSPLTLGLTAALVFLGPCKPPPPPVKTFIVDVVGFCAGAPIVGTNVSLWNQDFGGVQVANVDGWTRFTLKQTQAGGDLLHIQLAETPQCFQKDVEIRPSPLDGTDRPAGSGSEFRIDMNPRPPPHLDAGERGRVRVDNLRFAREDGSTYQQRSFSDFSLFQRWLRGEDISALLDERIGLGANMLRVFLMYNGAGIGNVNGMGELRPSSHADFYTKLTDFTKFLQTRGLRVEFVVFADAQDLMPGLSDQQTHLNRTFDALRNEWNVIIELCNEPAKNGCRLDELTVPSGLITASGDYDTVNCSIGHVRDFVTLHTERKPEWPRTPRSLAEVRDGADCLNAVHRPVTADEGTGAAEVARPDSRSDNPDDFGFYGGTAALMGAGATFHSDDGIASRMLGPKQKQAAQQYFWALKWAPVSAQFAPYQRGGAGGGSGIGNMPLQHFDEGENGTGALRTYCKDTEGAEWCIAIRPEPGWTARPLRGCTVVDEPRRGFVKLTCPAEETIK